VSGSRLCESLSNRRALDPTDVGIAIQSVQGARPHV